MFYLLSIQGQNRTGIVSDVTLLLYQNQVNILDSSMTTLRSEFAMMLVIALPEAISLESFSLQIQGLEDQHLSAFLRPLSEAEACHSSAESISNYSLSVIGQDRTGIIYHFSELLSDLGINITDVNTRLMDASEPALYAMQLELCVPEALSGSQLDVAIQGVAKVLDVDAHCYTIASIEI